jgi:NAD(P)-dependent dehydrogenase (short-subunit alcohol dehydrogenase family)
MLEGKAVVITGAGGGLGRSYALACAARGAQVVVNDVDADAARAVADEIRAYGGAATAFPAAVDDWDATEALVAHCVTTYGQLDALVANAGVRHEALPWEEEERRLRLMAEVNVLGTQFTVRHAMAAMVDAGRGGVILTIVSGARFGLHGMSAYGASKGAVAAMTAGWALEGAAVGIRVNGLSPLARTPMSLGDTREDRPPLPQPEAIAPVVPVLLSDRLRGVTGQLIRFDGSTLSAYSVPGAIDRTDEREEWDSEELASTLWNWF